MAVAGSLIWLDSVRGSVIFEDHVSSTIRRGWMRGRRMMDVMTVLELVLELEL